MTNNAATQRERIRQYLYRCQFGATRNVIARDTGLMVQTLCRRLRELEDLKHITRSRRSICPVTATLNIEYRLSSPQKARITRRRMFERHKPMSAEKVAKGKAIIKRMAEKRKAGRAA